MAKLPVNEFSPRERGLLTGHMWAMEFWATDGNAAVDDLRKLAGGEIDADTKEKIEVLLVESDGIENPTMFWGGFSHGVAALLAEKGYAA